MKVRVRLALLSAALSTLAILGCCAVLLVSANKASVQNAIDSALGEQRMLSTSFSAALDRSYEAALSQTTKRSLSQYLFRQYASNTLNQSLYAMRCDGEYLHNASDIDPAAVLAFDQAQTRLGSNEEARYVIVSHLNERYLVAGSSGTLFNSVYDVYLIKNIESVYRENAALTLRVAAIGLGTALAAAGLILLTVFRTLRSLQLLEESAAAVADGDYQSRIPIKGNDEIAALSKSFNRMAEAVEKHIGEINEVSEARKRLLAALTHELKTPMTAIIGYSEALMKTNLTPEQREEAVSYIYAECGRVERLSQKLMQLLALDSGGAISLTTAKMNELLEGVQKTLVPLSKTHGIKLSFTCDDGAFPMDTDLMASALYNLYDNARKAGAKHVMIACKNGVLSVSDDGCGIASEELKRVTEPFYRVDKSRSRKLGGMGLGLSLVKRIAELHGAKLVLLSERELGTSVEITFS